MDTKDLKSLSAVRRALRGTSPPKTITQEAYDFDRGHLARLVRLERDQPGQPDDLWSYTQDLRYSAIQPELFRYLLPVCLRAWHDDLRGYSAHGGFVEHFYPVLADRHVFDSLLTPEQSAAVARFMRESILAEIDDQRGLAYVGSGSRPYRWIRALTSYGVLVPDVQSLWQPWWSLGTIGRAVAAVQYVSALIYRDDENPIFTPWTRDQGGGPPVLWEFEGLLYSHRWLSPNIAFLRQTLSPPSAIDVLTRAVEQLRDQPEHEPALQILADVPNPTAILASRCEQLPNLLATVQEPGNLLHWSL